MSFNFDALLSATPTGEYMDIFSTFSLADDTSVYNANLWGGGGAAVDFTSIGHPAGGSLYCKLVAITKRHAITGQHNAVASEINDQYTWIAADGTRVTRTIVDVASYVSSGTATDAFHIVYLDADLPASINLCPISGITSSLAGTPAVKTDQEHHASVADIAINGATLSMGQPASSLRDTYYEPWITNDSGSPAFVLDGTQLVYITSAMGGGGGSGPYAADRLADILAACEDLDDDNAQTGYSPEVRSVQQFYSHISIGLSIGV